MTTNPLLDKEFLHELDQSRHKEIYAKVISLDLNENPIEQIEGRVTAGSINIDGASAVRRTCSLSLVAKEVNINEFYWGLSNKFKLFVGLKNIINPKYPDIIWFKMGTYVITSFNTSLSTNNYTINLSGKDKMCLLNGDIGGSLPSSVDFGCIEFYDEIYTEQIFEDPKAQYTANKYYYYAGKDATTQKDRFVLAENEYDSRIIYYNREKKYNIEKLPLKRIVREAIHTYANEPYHNIIINDLEDTGLELLEYRGDDEHPLYLIKNSGFPPEDIGDYPVPDGDINVVPNGSLQIYRKGKPEEIITLADLEDEEYDSLVDGFEGATEVVLLTGHPNQYYTVVKMKYADAAGYRLTDLVYAGDLIGNIGESLTSILDKIKNMLGDFEYFYDVDGRFVFQRKKVFINTSWNTLVNTEDEVYAESAAGTSSAIYSFEDNNLITAFQNTPVLTNLRNDFSVWGMRTTATGAEVPIHARFAIDTKPTFYKSLSDNNVYVSSLNELYPEAKIRDWRELIYQMAVDYFKFNQDPDFLARLIKANTALHRNLNTNEIELRQYYPTGFTGYENYYTDIQGFWRQLYNPDAKIEYTFTGGKYETVREFVNNDTGEFKEYEAWVPVEWSEEGTCDYYIENDHKYQYWNKNVRENPELLNFWFDFLDTGELQQFAVSVVGNRPKSVNDKDITSIYFRETPNIIYTSYENYNSADIKPGYVYAFISQGLESMFTISSQGKSAKNRIDELLYNHAYCIENINITAIPVYHLEPNTRIFVHDEDSQINGEYLVSKLTIPLTYNGTMSITATKAVERLY